MRTVNEAIAQDAHETADCRGTREHAVELSGVPELVVDGLRSRNTRPFLGSTGPDRHDERVNRRVAADSVARGLLEREDLLQMLDRAVTKRVTVISAPAGSGKTSLLRAWTDRSRNTSRVAFVSVDRDQQDA